MKTTEFWKLLKMSTHPQHINKIIEKMRTSDLYYDERQSLVEYLLSTKQLTLNPQPCSWRDFCSGCHCEKCLLLRHPEEPTQEELFNIIKELTIRLSLMEKPLANGKYVKWFITCDVVDDLGDK